MPDRRSDASGDDEGTYGWLYGGRGGSEDAGSGRPGAGADADQDEPTRVLPVARPESRRDRRGPGRRGDPSGPSTTAPPASAPTGSGRRRRIRWGRIVLMVVVLWLAFLIAIPLWAWGKVDKIAVWPSGQRPDAQPGTTYLLVGSDSRKGLTAAENRKLGTGGVGVDGGRTDTIMLLHTGDGPSLLLSIPRDSLVPIPGHGTGKINGAFAFGGPKLLVQTIEKATGLRIDHYVEIGLGGFVNAVDAIGGVKICPGRNINDRRANLHIKKGCQTADGATALAWSRSRHAFPQYGDIRRAQHQRAIVNAIGRGVKSPWTILNPWRYVHVNDGITSSLRVDDDMSIVSAANFAWAMSRVNGSAGKTCGMPISDLAVHWDRSRALDLIHYLKTDRTSDIPKGLCTQTGLKPR
jgi:LCP family protein required for cell wall assembly